MAAAVAATAAVVASVVAAVAVLSDDGSPTPPEGQGASTAPAPTAEPSPPGRVRLDDDRNVVILTWTDPSDGTAPFIVAGAREGEQPRAMAQIQPGDTRYAVNGLNPNLDYCFIIVAVYSTDQLIQSERVCTERGSGASARPSGT